jgi:hypothetical protein
MAAKLPTTVVKASLGDMKLTIANFDGTVSSNNIDDNDTWASGIKSALGYWVSSTIDGPQDCTIDAYAASTGTFTFASAADQTALVFVLSRDY